MSEQFERSEAEAAERQYTDADEVSWALREANRATSAVDVALARRLHLNPTDYTAMGHLMASREPLGPNELARQLLIAPASATELVDRLERAGHVERRRSDADRRRVEIHPTPGAIGAIIDELRPLFDQLDRIAAGLTDDERSVITSYLRHVAGATRTYLDDLERPERS